MQSGKSRGKCKLVQIAGVFLLKVSYTVDTLCSLLVSPPVAESSSVDVERRESGAINITIITPNTTVTCVHLYSNSHLSTIHYTVSVCDTYHSYGAATVILSSLLRSLPRRLNAASAVAVCGPQ